MTKEDALKGLHSYLKGIKVGKFNFIKLPIGLENWESRSQWVESRLKIDNTTYKFRDAQMTDKELIDILKTYIPMGKGLIEYNYIPRNYWYNRPEQYQFQSAYIFGKPCKEYVKFIKFVEKRLGRELKELIDNPLWQCRVCGKRHSWSEVGTRQFLMFEPKGCEEVLDMFKKLAKPSDRIEIRVQEHLSYGDEEDYRYAQKTESEWYGCIGNAMFIDVINKNGEEKGTLRVMVSDTMWLQ